MDPGSSSPSVLESLTGCPCRSHRILGSLSWPGQAAPSPGSPRTPGARSGHPASGHSSPASGSWFAALSGSPAPWCSPGGGGRGCQGSALARWKLSAHTQDRGSVSARPGESLSEICHHCLLSDRAAAPFPSSQTLSKWAGAWAVSELAQLCCISHKIPFSASTFMGPDG